VSEIRLKAVARLAVRKGAKGERPVIGLEDVQSGTGRLLTADRPVGGAGENLAFEPGDVLFGKLRPYLGKSLLVRSPLFGCAEFLPLRPKPTLEDRYLFYVTLSQPWLDWAVATSYGSKMPRTSWEYLGDYPMRLPSLEEQRRIADLLDDQVALLDRAIELRHRQGALEAERFANLREALIEGDEQAPRTPLLHLVDPTRPINYGVLMPGPRHEDGIPLVEAGDVMRGPLELPELRRTELAIEREFKRSRLRPGDLVMAIRGSIGAVQILPGGTDIINVTRDAARISLDGHIALNTYVRHALSTRRVQDWLRLRILGSAVTGINIGDLRRVRVVRPALSVQRSRAAELDKAEAYLDEIARLMGRSRALLVERRQAIITAAVTGRFDVATAQNVA